MKVPFFIAKRYVFSRSKSSAINIITGITSVGILVGSMVMFIVLSVFSGLREYSLQFINGIDPDLKLVSVQGKTIDLNSDLLNKLSNIDGIDKYSFFVEERVLLRHDTKEEIAFIKGVDSTFQDVTSVSDYIYLGDWSLEDNQVSVGYLIAHKLSIGIFDYDNTMQVMVPKVGKGSLSHDDFTKINVHPTSVYSFNDEDLDSRYVYSDLKLAQALLGYTKNQISGIEFRLQQGINESKVKSDLQAIFGDSVSIKNRTELNDTLHKMLNTENLIVYLIITLVVIITLFTLIGTIIMAVLDKRQNLKTLYSLGLRVLDLKSIFLYQGLLLSFIGCSVGLILGIAIVLLQEYFGFWMISDSLPYPIQFNFLNILIVFSTIMFLSFIASKIASDRVSEKLL